MNFNLMKMYLQNVGILKVTDEKSRIRIRTKMSQIRGTLVTTKVRLIATDMKTKALQKS
jgi:hypothetical protein